MVTIALLLAAVIFTPFFVEHHFLLFRKYVVQEDAVEAIFIIILLLITYLLSNVYKKKLKKYRQETSRLERDKSELLNRFTEAFKYIGGVNVQIQEIRSIFCGLRKYPATESAFKADLALFARKLLGIVNTDWVMIRIIRPNNMRTIKEHVEFRKNRSFINKGISNKAIVIKCSLDGYSIVTSHYDNSMIMVACIVPKKSLTETENILVEAITYQIKMLYFMFVSCQPHDAHPNHKIGIRGQKK
jgi:hypothetical protein